MPGTRAAGLAGFWYPSDMADDPNARTMLEVIGNAGYVVSLAPDPQGFVVITATATDPTGEVWCVRADNELEAVVELATMLEFEDLD